MCSYTMIEACINLGSEMNEFISVMRIRIRRISMFLDLPYPVMTFYL
jgi:hypothetical protein